MRDISKWQFRVLCLLCQNNSVGGDFLWLENGGDGRHIMGHLRRLLRWPCLGEYAFFHSEWLYWGFSVFSLGHETEEMRMKRRSRCLPLVAACLLAHCVCAALEIPGADGSDGALRVTKESCVEGVYTIDLGQAATRLWDSTSPRSGKGVYDPEKWAVVFKYTSVQIDEGCTVKFVNHPSNPPVYWLVSGDVDICGEINLDGDRGQDNGLDMDIGPAVCAKPGPGGFAGGLSMTWDSNARYSYFGGGGYGPGGATSQLRKSGGDLTGGGGSFATLGKSNTNKYDPEEFTKSGSLYGNDTLIPLIGGSGGAGYNGTDYDDHSMTGGGAGGAGGGAICIAAKGTVNVNGNITARGNRGGGYRYDTTFYFHGGCGSGGGVRILAEAINGSGSIDVSSLGGTAQSLGIYIQGYKSYIYNRSIGGAGRIRLDTNKLTLCNRDFSAWNVQPSLGNGDQVVLWADAKITLLTLGGARLPADPVYRQSGYNECVSFATAGERELVFRTENIPTDANVVVKVTPRQSSDTFTGTTVVATMDKGGTYASATWRAMIPLNDARTTFQVLVSTVPLNE